MTSYPVGPPPTHVGPMQLTTVVRCGLVLGLQVMHKGRLGKTVPEAEANLQW